MGFGEDLRGELFGKLGVESESDPLKLIEQGKAARETGNNQGAKKAFEQSIEISKVQAEKYISQNQHRAASEALYIQALALGYLDRTEEQHSIYQQVVDRLLEAGKTAMAFGENNRGVAQATLAGMVALLYDDQTKAFEIYNNYLEISQEKENSGYLQKLLYSLGYLLDALENDNMGALTDAQNYISTDLRPMLSTAKLGGFETLLETALQHTQDVLQSKIKLPNLQVGTSLPRDIQFNQLFDFDVTIENDGNGQATSLELSLNIPDDIEVVDGETYETIAHLDPQQEIKRKLQLRFLTGDTSGEQTREIQGNVVYFDMLGNSHKQYFGPIELGFTAVSKKEEYLQRLKETTTPMDPISTEDLHDAVLPGILDIVQQQIDKFGDQIRSKIEEEEFSQVEFGLDLLQFSVDQAKQLTNQNELTQKLDTQIAEVVEKTKIQLEEELRAKFDEEKQQALEEAKSRHDEELSAKIDQLKSDLNEQHTKEMNQLRDKHQEEMQNQQRDHETKVNQAITSHENKLKEEFNKEIASLKEEHEATMRQLKSQHQTDLEHTKSGARDEANQKNEQKIKDLEQSLDDLRDQLRSQYEEELAKKDAEIERLKSASETQ